MIGSKDSAAFTQTKADGQTSCPNAYGLERTEARLWKALVKRLLVGGYCRGVVPAAAVRWAFDWLGLANE